MNVALPEADELGVAVREDVHANRVQVRKLTTGAVLLPVVWIAFQQNIFSRSLLCHAESSQNDTRVRLACHARGRNRNFVKQPFQSCDWVLKFNNDSIAIERAQVSSTTGAERVSLGRVQARVERSFDGRDDIVGR